MSESIHVVTPRIGETEEALLPPIYVKELIYLSLGYSRQYCTRVIGGTENEVKDRRQTIRKFFAAGNLRQAVVGAIHGGYIPIEVDASAGYEKLSPRQESVLRLLALGWGFGNIANRYGVSTNTINNHSQEIRRRLEARSMPHAIRRAFEVGLFKVGEEILDSDQLAEAENDGLHIVIDGKDFTPQDAGIFRPHEIEILDLLGRLEKDSFTRSDIYGLGFYQEAVSPNAKAQAYKRSLSSLLLKLEQFVGEPVVGRGGPQGARSYRFKKSMAIGRLDDMRFIPAFDEHEAAVEIPLPEPAPKKRKEKTIDTILKSTGIEKPVAAAQSLESEIVIDYLDPAVLPELNSEFLAKLQARDPQEVLKNDDIKKSVLFAANEGSLYDYFSRVVVALRYGIKPNGFGSSQSIYRNGTYFKLDDIMWYVPPYQGLEVKDVSEILGITQLGVLRVERKFLKSLQTKYPSLKILVPIIELRMEQLELQA